MNQVSRQTQADAPPSLAHALNEVFTPRGGVPFARRLVGFTEALMPGVQAYLVTAQDEDLHQIWPESSAPADALDLLRRLRDSEEMTILADRRFLAAPVCLEQGSTGFLVLEQTQGGQTGLALSHERLTLLSRLSFASFRPDLIAQLQEILQLLAHQNEGQALQALADRLCAFTGSDYAAVAHVKAGSLSDLHVSGQQISGKTAGLAAKLKREMKETARLNVVSSERAFAGSDLQTGGVVFHLEAPRRLDTLLPLFAGAAAQLAHTAPRATLPWRKIRRWAIVVIFFGALAFVPIPDGVDLPATVSSSAQRIITSPLDAPLQSISVRAGETVVAGETELARFDTEDIDLQLITAQSAYSKALLDRERARASRLAADLRATELEAEQIVAEITYLQARKANAILVAPISGLVIGENLGDLIGVHLRRGDQVLEIADPSVLELDVFVPQSQMGKVQAGAEGLFRPDFDPSLRIAMRLESISPAAPADDRAPLYPARALFEGTTDQLRPGMTGVVAVDRDFKPIGEIVWNALRDWVLLRLWI